jgi:hypothetical protein
MDEAAAFRSLEEFLVRVPAIAPPFGRGFDAQDGWWIKFGIDIDHPLAWQVVQEFGHVLNYLSLDERLPTRFMPVSPPPYMNGGPREFLSWVIECPDPNFGPGTASKWLEGRLPTPVDDLAQWDVDDGEADE